MSFVYKDIPLGKCCQCGVTQEQRGHGGIWINGYSDKWACYDCKYGRTGKPSIRSYPMACEWCTYSDVKWSQGHTYKCPRCTWLMENCEENLLSKNKQDSV
jgi:hypothetical protein